MSTPSTLSEAQRDGWDDSPFRCIECGLYAYPSDVECVATERGPICKHCAKREGLAA